MAKSKKTGQNKEHIEPGEGKIKELVKPLASGTEKAKKGMEPLSSPEKSKKQPEKKAVKKKQSLRKTAAPAEKNIDLEIPVNTTAITLISEGGGGFTDVTYTLTKDPGITVGLILFGFTQVELAEDQDGNTGFSTKNGKVYSAELEPDGSLYILVDADGQIGETWSMTVQKNETGIADNPIEVEVTDTSGTAKHEGNHL